MKKLLERISGLFEAKNKPPVAVPRRFRIAPEDLPEYWRLSDAYMTTPSGQDKYARFKLWDFIATRFPEIRRGSWERQDYGPFRVEIVEDIGGK